MSLKIDGARPDPDKLLARVQAEEAQEMRGKLKIFLGYAAGVGKTYAMLEAAHQRKNDGVDIADFPKVHDHFMRVAERPAVKRAKEKHG